ncbi:sorting nexin-19 [Macrotis lagotis]|uniref:sorting nexin-19 n=1 Tax=Macrotis lagotis TaxID=92651 RepID=UPI003D6862BA
MQARPGAAAPLPGGRKLLALAAGLAWLLLLHLLVDVWLLGLVSLLLLALGGWAGSRAVAGAGGRLHLERFVRLAGCPGGGGGAEARGRLEREIERTVQKVVRDFVSSWHRGLSREPAFEEEVRAAMLGMARELRRRMARVDRRALSRRVLALCGRHLQGYLRAREAAGPRGARPEPARLWEAYGAAAAAHPALRGPGAELRYARAAVDRALQGLTPAPHLRTRTGRYLVVELLACNVLLPLVAKMSDPDWIHLALVGVFSKAGPARPAEPAPPPVPRALPLAGPPEEPAEERSPAPAPPRPEEGGPGLPRPPDARGPLFVCEDAELDSPLSDAGRDAEAPGPVTPGDLAERLQDALAALTAPVGAALTAPEPEAPEAEPRPEAAAGLLASMLKPCPEIQINPAEKEEEGDPASPAPLLDGPERACLPRPSCLERDFSNGVSPLDPSLPQGLLSSSPTGPLSSATFSFEPLSSPDGPVVIQNLRITGTITAREHSGTSFHPYTLYTVKYETALDSENSSGLQQVAYHTVNRRYREFLNLQTRLEEKPDLRKFIKNVKGPKKLFPDLPFGNMDSDRVEARKSLLESFLKQLCAIPEIANSEEVQEFLALNTDARIAFVKKPFMVSRIDKMVVSAIVDTIKTAFPRSEPQSPTEDLSEAETDGKPQTEGKKNKSRLRFPSSKIAPVLNVAESHEKVLYCLPESNVESDILSISGMESFLEKQSKFLEIQAEEALGKDSEQTPNECTDNGSESPSDSAASPPEESNSDQESETALADTALDLLLLLMMEQWRWLCTENMQKAIHLLFGTLIQRWLEVQVANLTCPQRWVQYLRLLQESIWPGGTLPLLPKPLRTQKQKEATEEQALQSLMGVLPDLVVGILGASKCRLSWGLVLESLQQPIINRHLIYCLWDIILEVLDLSVSAEESTTTTSAPDTPSNSRRMGVSP